MVVQDSNSDEEESQDRQQAQVAKDSNNEVVGILLANYEVLAVLVMRCFFQSVSEQFLLAEVRLKGLRVVVGIHSGTNTHNYI